MHHRKDHRNTSARPHACVLARLLLTVGALSVLLGCAAVQDGRTYAQSLTEQPLPDTDQKRIQECEMLRRSISAEHDRANQRAVFAEGMEAVENRANLEQHLLALEGRMAQIGCSSASAAVMGSTRSGG